MKISDNPEKNTPSDEEDSKRSTLIRSQKDLSPILTLSRNNSGPAFRKSTLPKGSTLQAIPTDADGQLNNTHNRESLVA